MKPSQATIVVDLATGAEGFELFRADQDGYAMVPVGGHRECWPVRSTMFRRWLSRLYFEHEGAAPGGQAVTDAVGVLEGAALFAGAEHDVHIRIAEHGGATYVDLADAEWRAVRIDASGWTVVSDPPVRFRRARGMLALPCPEPGGSFDQLRDFVNVVDDDWPLLLGFVVGCVRPRGPYPVLLVHGEQGSAKTTTVRVVRSLIDPNEAPVRREPRNGQDLIVAARNGAVVAFDNISALPSELSDDLARLATGAGFGARMLYTDADEIVVHVARPIVLNGIEEVATRGDLLDRAVILTLPRIARYLDEDAFWRTFDAAHARLLGAVLDAVSTALARIGETPTPNVRMADFARWVTAAEPALGVEPGAFVRAYRENRSTAVQLLLESSPLSAPIRALAAQGFEGSASQLLATLGPMVTEDLRKDRSWPKRPHVLSGRLRRIAPALRRVGVDVVFDIRTDSVSPRQISIRQLAEVGNQASTASTSVHPAASVDALDAVDASPHISTSAPDPTLDGLAAEGVLATCCVCGERAATTTVERFGVELLMCEPCAEDLPAHEKERRRQQRRAARLRRESP